MRLPRAGLALALLGCAEPERPESEIVSCLDDDEITSAVPDLPIAYTTEHLDIHVTEDRFLCAGSVIEYERHVQYIADELGIEIQRRIPVYAMRDTGDHCPGADACVPNDGVVFATESTMYHELAHGVACEIRSAGPPILSEGVAVAFEPGANDQMGVPQDFAEIRLGDFGPHYDAAGHFTRWLAGELGPERFADLYRTATHADGVWLELAAAHGSSIAEDYAAKAPFMWVPHRQCADMPLLEPDAEGAWTFEARLDCEHETTLGPYEKAEWFHADAGKMYQSFLIDVPEPGTYRVRRPPNISVEAYYQRCLDEHPMTEQAAEDEWINRSVSFTLTSGFDEFYGLIEFEFPGLWRFDVTHEHGPPVIVWLTITPEL